MAPHEAVDLVHGRVVRRAAAVPAGHHRVLRRAEGVVDRYGAVVDGGDDLGGAGDAEPTQIEQRPDQAHPSDVVLVVLRLVDGRGDAGGSSPSRR